MNRLNMAALPGPANARPQSAAHREGRPGQGFEKLVAGVDAESASLKGVPGEGGTTAPATVKMVLFGRESLMAIPQASKPCDDGENYFVPPMAGTGIGDLRGQPVGVAGLRDSVPIAVLGSPLGEQLSRPLNAAPVTQLTGLAGNENERSQSSVPPADLAHCTGFYVKEWKQGKSPELPRATPADLNLPQDGDARSSRQSIGSAKLGMQPCGRSEICSAVLLRGTEEENDLGPTEANTDADEAAAAVADEYPFSPLMAFNDSGIPRARGEIVPASADGSKMLVFEAVSGAHGPNDAPNIAPEGPANSPNCESTLMQDAGIRPTATKRATAAQESAFPRVSNGPVAEIGNSAKVQAEVVSTRGKSAMGASVRADSADGALPPAHARGASSSPKAAGGADFQTVTHTDETEANMVLSVRDIDLRQTVDFGSAVTGRAMPVRGAFLKEWPNGPGSESADAARVQTVAGGSVYGPLAAPMSEKQTAGKIPMGNLTTPPVSVEGAAETKVKTRAYEKAAPELLSRAAIHINQAEGAGVATALLRKTADSEPVFRAVLAEAAAPVRENAYTGPGAGPGNLVLFQKGDRNEPVIGTSEAAMKLGMSPDSLLSKGAVKLPISSTIPVAEAPSVGVDRRRVAPTEMAATETAEPPFGSGMVTAPKPQMPASGQTVADLVQSLGGPPATDPSSPTVFQAAWATPGSANKPFKIKLHPIELGEVTVTLRVKDGQLCVEMKVETEQARKVLSSDTDTISANLAALGYPVDQVLIQGPQSSQSSSASALQGRNDLTGSNRQEEAKRGAPGDREPQSFSREKEIERNEPPGSGGANVYI